MCSFTVRRWLNQFRDDGAKRRAVIENSAHHTDQRRSGNDGCGAIVGEQRCLLV
jgi:hypothetical protein